jgi:hypothetical protein
VAPAAFAYQGYAGNRAMFGITVERVSQAIVGELTVEEAVARMADDLDRGDVRVKGDRTGPRRFAGAGDPPAAPMLAILTPSCGSSRSPCWRFSAFWG